MNSGKELQVVLCYQWGTCHLSWHPTHAQAISLPLIYHLAPLGHYRDLHFLCAVRNPAGRRGMPADENLRHLALSREVGDRLGHIFSRQDCRLDRDVRRRSRR